MAPSSDDLEPGHHLLRRDCAVADRGEEVVDAGQPVGLGHLGDPLRAELLERRARQAAQLAFERLAAVDDVDLALLALEPLPDLVLGVAGHDLVEPVARRTARGLGGDDLDDVAVVQLVVERHEAVVDLGADARVADVGVDAVGEVERRRARGEILDVAARREHEDLVLEQVDLQPLDELGRVGRRRAASPSAGAPRRAWRRSRGRPCCLPCSASGRRCPSRSRGAWRGSGSGPRAACRRGR